MKLLFKKISRYIYDIKQLFFPKYCPLCDSMIDNNGCFCIECLSRLPLTYNWHNTDNIIYSKIYNKSIIRYGASLMDFEKGDISQKIIHLIKYKNRKDIAVDIGRYFGVKLSESILFRDIDIIIPLPLHYKKQKKRGYNQSYLIAMGISEVLKIELNNNIVKRVKNNISQTKLKTVNQRADNVLGIFSVTNPELLRGKSILIIDDVCTTGETISSLVREINNCADDCIVNIATLTTV